MELHRAAGTLVLGSCVGGDKGGELWATSMKFFTHKESKILKQWRITLSGHPQIVMMVQVPSSSLLE